MTEPDAVKLARDVIVCWQEAGIGEEKPDEVVLARAVLDLAAERDNLRAALGEAVDFLDKCNDPFENHPVGNEARWAAMRKEFGL